ncbi:uncharacterized protein MONBRDRAFT_6134 [Monosiga brevicollis MX1]|uniref:Ankyrin repeat domain-containing protein n=1 Tax=Monosiga brevicollis TaxID=81824 RepID=A9USX6_MONBE|nr:uncharacterized protein MONBRDRAFT_6134 [Monosiga brevicollis MX1]EDQ91144.1 predicted protein [Monosiga brevicollis MX1]|eukprot:XP_001743566.1 hypothetical protein [Monosiga brevicollis MX1]
MQALDLHEAAQEGNRDALVQALAHNDVNAVDVTLHNRTALHWAATTGNVACVRILLQAGANVRAAQSNNGWLPIHAAAEADEPDVIRELVRADPGLALAIDRHGDTPLDVAQRFGHADSVHALREAINASQASGSTAFSS